MDRVNSPEATCDRPAFFRSDGRTAAVPCHRSRQTSFGAMLRLVPFCLIMMLLGSPANGETATDDKLAPQDTVEISVSGWHTLLGGVAEARLLNDAFTIGASGTVELPVIGRVTAAGLSERELAKLIADLLQARSGSDQRPVTKVQRREPAAEVPSSPATTRVDGPRPATEHPGYERSRVDALLSDLAAARKELDKARGEARAVRQAARDAAAGRDRRLAAERQRVAAVTEQLNAARSGLAAAKTRLEQEANTARDLDAAVAKVNEARQLATRERAKSAELESKLLAARKELDAFRGGALLAGREREEILRSDLAVAKGDLEATRRAADDGRAQARAAAAMAAEQGRALANERRRAEGLARELGIVRREFERLAATTDAAMQSKAAALRARNAAEASLADATQALEVARQKLSGHERALAIARRSALEARAELRAAKQAALQAGALAELAASRAGEALDLEREKARALARDLEIARQERDAAMKELAASSAAQSQALEERDNLNGRRPALERGGGDVSKQKARPRKASTGQEQSGRADDRASEHARPVARKQKKPVRDRGAADIRKVELAKPPRPDRSVPIVLPDSLLPRQSPIRGLW
ncbi:hypothetical protein J2Z31_005123 [Sinorhizobium kostiense]|uniref:Polysaccharide export protein N-terminal domain-containing protein n=1 Tax=Sinorhizobium kostiense TaxID=76747 RepID=A0ABS4R875_9HYPH|nr:polysaccharide biosynthesis/export family protein [Sinorhizobium kostiense]MBP2238586.1 hypothetical protein [Sinorhizobium kostiense]